VVPPSDRGILESGPVRRAALSCASRPGPPACERLRLDEDHPNDPGERTYKHRRHGEAPPLRLVGQRTRRSDGVLGSHAGEELILGVDLKEIFRGTSHQAEETSSATPSASS